jgi:hypothetical protein
VESRAHCARDAAARWHAIRIKCAPAAHAHATHPATSSDGFYECKMNKLRLWARQIREMWHLMNWNQRLGLSFQGVIAGATIFYVVVAVL